MLKVKLWGVYTKVSYTFNFTVAWDFMMLIG